MSTERAKYKKGRMSKLEIQYIEDNAYFKQYNIIAEKLNRDPETVKSHIEGKMGLVTSLAEGKPAFNPDEHESIREKEFWPVLIQQFTAPELEMFEYHWNKVSGQFHHDILPTEELQMLDMIKMEILMNRNLRKQKETSEESLAIHDRIVEQESLSIEDKNIDLIMKLREQTIFFVTSGATLTKEYQSFQDRKDKIFVALKATRKDRITRIESSKESFLSWMADMIDNSELREAVGTHIEKFRLASIDEEVRLSGWHKYIDGSLDRPLLNSETVTEED